MKINQAIKQTLIATTIGMAAVSMPAHAWFFGPSKEEVRIQELEKQNQELKGQVEKSKSTEVIIRPENSNIQLPPWFVKIPEPNETHMFVPGTATSTSLNMAIQKAQADADIKVAFHTQTAIQAMLKLYQVDSGSTVVEDTELAARRVTDIFVSGQQQKDIVVQREGRQFRVFVLMQYPVEPITYFANQARKAYGIDDKKQKAFDELNQTREDNAKQETRADTPATPSSSPVTNSGSASSTSSSPVPQVSNPTSVELKPASQVDLTTLPHNNIADQQLRAKIDEILKRPDAVVGTLTVQ